MPPKATVTAYVCTFCKVAHGKEVIASVVTTFGLEAEDSVNFKLVMRTVPAIKFDEASALTTTVAACLDHESSIVNEQIGGFIHGLDEVAEAAQEAEAEDLVVEELPEGAEEFEDNNEEEKEDIPEPPKADAAALMDRIAAKAAGTKVVPDNAAQRVNNPKPEEKAEVIEEWMTFFEDGYEPSTAQPKGAEKDACFAWWNVLPLRTRKELAPKGWPERGSLTQKTVLAWHKTKDYADFLRTVEELANA